MRGYNKKNKEKRGKVKMFEWVVDVIWCFLLRDFKGFEILKNLEVLKKMWF